MKIFLLLLFISTISFKTYTQEYSEAFGIRGGLTSGLTYKKFLNEEVAMEAILSFRERGMQMTVVRQLHEITLIEFTDKLFFMKGYGGHLGYTFSDKYRFFFREFNYPHKRFSPVFGMDAYLGMEYRMESFPLALGIDYKPYFEISITHPFQFRIWDIALFIRYSFE
ncbi:hypothetical protein ACFLSA_04645 [Bacteroidota bacterium]